VIDVCRCRPSVLVTVIIHPTPEDMVFKTISSWYQTVFGTTANLIECFFNTYHEGTEERDRSASTAIWRYSVRRRTRWIGLEVVERGHRTNERKLFVQVCRWVSTEQARNPLLCRTVKEIWLTGHTKKEILLTVYTNKRLHFVHCFDIRSIEVIMRAASRDLSQ